MSAITGARRAAITVSVMLATLMQSLDLTILNVALPQMQGSLLASQDQIAWVLTSYIVVSAILMPATGFLAARLGRKRLFAWAVAGFTAASMLCGMAISLEQMVLFRALQGAFGAALVPLSQLVLLDTYPREQHGQAMAIWGVGIMVGPILGPSLGGWLTEVYDWRWVFYINLPIGILALAGILAVVPESRPVPRPFDAIGLGLLAIGIGALQLMLDRGELKGWFASTEIVIEAALAALGLYLFVVHILTAKRPFLDPRMFLDRNFASGLVLIFAVGAVLLASLTLIPAFMQGPLGYPVATAGWLLAPRGMGTMAAMLLVSRLVGWMDPRPLILVGLALTAASLWQMSGFTADVSQAAVVGSGVLQGFGVGTMFVPLSAVTFSTLEARYRPDATAMFSLTRNIGSSIGISAMVTLLARNTQVSRSELAPHASPFNPLLREPGPAESFDLGTAHGLAMLEAEVMAQAEILAYLQDFRLLALITVAAMPLVLLLKPAQRRAAPAMAAG